MNRIVNAFLYGGLTKEEYAGIEKEIFNYNKNIWKIIAVLGWISSLYLMISAFSMRELAENLGTYLFLMISAGVLGIVMFFGVRQNRKMLSFLMTAYIIVFLFFGILLGVAQTPDQMTVTFHVLMICIPLVIIIRPIHNCVIELVMLCVYCYMTIQCKIPEIRSVDIYNGVTFFFVAQMLNIIIVRTKLNEILLRKKIEIVSLTDELTKMNNRHAYESDLRELEEKGMGKNVTFLSLDVNGLKRVNDSMGHAAGDELICGAANCMKKAFEDYGKVYRVGGDEMTAILTASKSDVEKVCKSFRDSVDSWHGSIVPGLSVSLGVVRAEEFPNCNVDELERIADQRMYDEKAAYYKQNQLKK